MDLRAYYRKIHEAEALLDGDHFIVVSLATSEGGKEGVRTQVPRSIAARLLTEACARMATAEEEADFLKTQREDRDRFELEQTARRMQVVVVAQPDTRPKERT